MKKSNDAFDIFLFSALVVFIFLSLIGIWYSGVSTEISPSYYHTVSEVVQEQPQLKSYVRERYKDGVITIGEYNDIMDQSKQLKENRVGKDVLDEVLQ